MLKKVGVQRGLARGRGWLVIAAGSVAVFALSLVTAVQQLGSDGQSGLSLLLAVLLGPGLMGVGCFWIFQGALVRYRRGKGRPS